MKSDKKKKKKLNHIDKLRNSLKTTLCAPGAFRTVEDWTNVLIC